MAESAALKHATARDFLAVVFRQMWVIVTVFLIAVVSVVVVSWRTPTVYRSESRVLVDRGKKQSVLQPNLQVLSYEEEINSEIETVKSFPVAQRAQAILNQWYAEGGKLPRKMQLNPSGVDAEVVEQSNVIKVVYTSRDPEICRPVVNALTQAYMEFHHEATTVPYVNEFFNREIASVDSAMSALLAQRQEFLKATGTVAPPDERHELFSLKQGAETELSQIQQQVRLTDQNIRQARDYLASADPVDPAYFLQFELGNEQTLSYLKQKFNELLQQKETLSTRETPEHPELKGIMKSLAELKDQTLTEARSSIVLLEERARTLAERQRTTSALVDRYRVELERIPGRESRLGELDSQLQTLRDRYKELVGKEIQVRISQATSADVTVTLFAPASRPVALRTTDYVRLALAPILSLVVGLMLAFFLDSVDHSLKNAGDVEEFLGIPVLASLPDTKS